MVNRLLQTYLPLSLPHTFESIFFTGYCVLCGNHSYRNLDLCLACENELPWLDHRCQRCALPLPEKQLQEDNLCAQCLFFPPNFNQLETLWHYKPPISQLIRALKYQRRYSYGRVLVELMAKKIASTYLHQKKPDLLVATPLHWWRYLKRGFNQSEYLCAYLSSYLNIPIYHKVKKIRATPPQQTLDSHQRQNNIIGAFSVPSDESLKYQNIAVIDDVVTTGATVNELSRCLLAAGANDVSVWCLARTPL